MGNLCDMNLQYTVEAKKNKPGSSLVLHLRAGATERVRYISMDSPQNTSELDI